MIRKTIFIALLQIICVSAVHAQAWKGVEVKGGLLFSEPSSLKGMNTYYETKAKTGWQFGLTKNFELYKALNLEIGTGYSQHHFQAKEEDPTGRYPEQSLSLSYAFLETGLNLRPKSGRISPYAGGSFRLGGLINTNLDEHFSILMGYYKRYDYGLNFRAGISYKTGPVEPFIEGNFYHGFPNVGDKNGVQLSNSDGIIKNQLYNQFWGLQLGIKF